MFNFIHQIQIILITMKGTKKSDLPKKTCPICKLPFTWRKKWEKDWLLVLYCSKKCQSNK